MPFLMDNILNAYADLAFEASRLGRIGVHPTRDSVCTGVLAKLEACGEAMRFVDAKGRIAWKATPNLRQYLKDLKLDAQDDMEDL
jgi:hypothetical protein